ncbi:hypothetical protein K493DRAFT_329867 [Basidiobolus meristosporus CBS 931.73]|uniref:Glycosyltransferase family 49 protein n=1 Tax=Basidiobolus meristosporus CBS 931.73 TaxID=1314790 RepID=A0A1Y1Y9Q5_9FUNG|nr:hypothetical protein K493DRAFT_329867 [Basidiobolus meristosporus CBS 931.73]|eukprot:ORX94731.1 hypothetical protein K493DRAFT_329867 [Basidiobolus meristosporus CBS 931.73]
MFGGHNNRYVYSKLFSSAMQPSNLEPFYIRAELIPSPDDITITTLITPDRFEVFEKLINHYQGPISATLHVDETPEKRKILGRLQAMYMRNPSMRRYVDVHLIVDSFERQFNYWRNVARFFARTKYILMLDVDFFPCTNLRQNLQRHPQLLGKLREGNAAIVIPAFEYGALDEGRNSDHFPRTKDALIKVVRSGHLDMFHKVWQQGHGSTNYTRWYSADQPYLVTEYTYSYEPYVVVKKDAVPWCDERFIGYGANKAACLYEIYLSGTDFWVLPNDFLIHQNHDYPEVTRRMERKLNKQIYTNFREESCYRYWRNALALGTWNSPRSSNARRECSKIPEFMELLNELDNPNSISLNSN